MPSAAPPRLSAFLIVHDEARHLPDCLASLAGLADEVVVLDDGSTDDTVAIARAAGARVSHRPFDDFGRQKQAALELTAGRWVLSIDADERVTPELARAIRTVVDADGPAAGYWLRRQVVYLGARLRFGGAGRDWVLRLARRESARFNAAPIHERILVDGPEARLVGTLDHVQYRSLSEHLRKLDRYTDAIAEQKLARGRRFSGWHVLRIPAELFARLFLRLGVLDGRPGVIYAGMAAFYGFLKYAKLWRAADR
ncbi:MAG TPA: glycosyltransferase family 2 protein [Gemmatimonadaceae bacterium]|nr:glycosyltransferase family 2 protein [Gemmatimonadaceae bacterium]